MKKIGLLKNQHNTIVVLIPKHIIQLKELAEVYIETGAGLNIGYSDDDYIAAGAQIIDNSQLLIANCDVILCYDQIPRKFDSKENKTFVSFMNLRYDFSPLLDLIGKNVNAFSLDLLPRSSIAQSMDVLSTVASISGYQAVLMAAELLPISVPMITSAGGTLRPARFLILGSGVAGLQAIATAKRMGAIVKAFDVRKASRTEVESLGAEFIDINGAVENLNSGGYAIEQSSDYLDKIEAVISSEAIQADVIITTAKIPGKQAPILIKEITVDKMKFGAVIIDLAAETGGNCSLTKLNETIVHNNVTIVGINSMISKSAISASTLISGNYTSFLKHLLKHDSETTQDDIILSTKVISHGNITHEELMQTINQF